MHNRTKTRHCAGCGFARGVHHRRRAAAPNTLVVAKAAAAPALDGNANDAAWASAKPLSVKLAGGANFGTTGETTATLKAVTSAT